MAAVWAKSPAPKWPPRWSWRRKITATVSRPGRCCASKPAAYVCREANLGLAAIADIHAAIVDLRRYTPVVGIITGTVGCFGGMSIAAALCSYLIVTREARLGLNGPQVIEQEAGIEEYDSRNRPFIWSMTGGEIRAASGLVDALVNDGVNAVKTAMNEAIAKGVPAQHRSDNYDDYLRRLSQFDTRQQADTAQIKQLFAREDK